MKMLDKNGNTVDVIPDEINRFVNLCPQCGEPLKKKTAKKAKTMFQRNVSSMVCLECGYAEYTYNETENAILNGHFDEP